jgi:outer membrane murein-binding lipoprotein Lpp
MEPTDPIEEIPMIRHIALFSILLTGLFLVGCSSNEPAKPAATPGQAGDSIVKDAQAVIAKVMDLIKENKLDDAETQLKTLEAKSSTLPKDLQDKIKAAREALGAAKTAGKLPAVPK